MHSDIQIELAGNTPQNITSSRGKGSIFKKLGPGLVTGAADDDPSGIATYSQAGAKFGYNLLWTIALTYPLMVAVQMISARIGAASGQGLATNIRTHYPKGILYPLVALLCVANIINIAADIAAMGAAGAMLIGGKAEIYALLLGATSLVLQVFIPYQRYVNYLKWLTLVLFSYVATVFVVHVPWEKVAMHTLVPHWEWTSPFATMVVAILGTTISPYLFFWQASQEVEEQYAHSSWRPLRDDPARAAAGLRRIRLDTTVGMLVSNGIAFFIILSAAVTLNAHGIHHINDSVQAATALRPLAGEAAFLLFGLGIIGTGMLALPVLAGSAAYALAGALQWRNGLALPFSKAKAFYGSIIIATMLGIGLSFTAIDPMAALFWSAVINGVVAVPVMIIMMLLSMRSDVMGDLRLPPVLKIFGWLATGIMLVATVAMLALQLI